MKSPRASNFTSSTALDSADFTFSFSSSTSAVNAWSSSSRLRDSSNSLHKPSITSPPAMTPRIPAEGLRARLRDLDAVDARVAPANHHAVGQVRFTAQLDALDRCLLEVLALEFK